jgi:hypothetical protein
LDKFPLFPTKPLLIACTTKKYSLWQPGDAHSTRKPTKDLIDSMSFAPSGDFYVISYSTGVVNVVSTETETIVQTFTYLSVVTSLSFVTLDSNDYIVIADLSCRVSLFHCPFLPEVKFESERRLKSIGPKSFSQCHPLNRICLLKQVEVLGSSCFSGCLSFREMLIEPGSILRIISSKTFLGSGLERFSVPDCVEEMCSNVSQNVIHFVK